jgi:hypothetical protein
MEKHLSHLTGPANRFPLRIVDVTHFVRQVILARSLARGRMLLGHGVSSFP